MYRVIMLFMATVLLTSCMNSPTTRGNGSNYATRDVEVVFGEEQTYPRIALVIGNNNYQRHKKLINAVPDARAIRDFLKSRGFKVVYAEDADKATMDSKINEFMSSLGKKSVAVIYYSGHASQDKSRRTGEPTNYLLPINDSSLTSITDYDRNAISMNYILSKAGELNHGLNIAILDACRTPIGRGGIIQDIGAKGIYMVYATASGVTASDSGIFRKSFLKYANRPLKLVDILEKVKVEVYNKEGQLPSVSNNKIGTFYFTQATPTPTPIYRPQPISKPRVTTTQKGKWNPLIYRGKRSYSKNTTNTVKDNYTGLIWQREDDGVKRNWEDAKRYCSNLLLDGYSDWRLPTIEELYYLGDMTKVKPAIDTNYFSVKNHCYWSSTTYKNDSSNAWYINFKGGNNGWFYKVNKNWGLALCVR